MPEIHNPQHETQNSKTLGLAYLERVFNYFRVLLDFLESTKMSRHGTFNTSSSVYEVILTNIAVVNCF